jgi:hypothetical protein
MYVIENDVVVNFTDNEGCLLIRAGLVVLSPTIPARLDVTAFVWDDLGLEGDRAIMLLRRVADAADPTREREAQTREMASERWVPAPGTDGEHLVEAADSPPGELLDFTVEFRVDVQARNVDDATMIARERFGEGWGRVTAVFDADGEDAA